MPVRAVKKSFMVLLLFLSGVLLSRAQNEINFTTFSSKDGLSSNTINAIVKDKDGLMWFATSDGLNKFDGTNFTVYRHVAGDKYSLPGNDVLSLHEDSKGRMWVGTSLGGICYYDRKYDRFSPFKGLRTDSSFLHLSAKSITEDHAGNIWIATYNAVKMFDPETGKVSTFLNGQPKAKSGQYGLFTALCVFEDSRGRMWIGTNDGLYLYNSNKKTFTRFMHSDADAGSISNDVIKTIAEDARGDVWFGSFGGLNKLLPDGHFQAFKRNGRGGNSVSSDKIYAMIAAGSNLWIGTEDGVDILNINTLSFRHEEPDHRNSFSLKNRSVRSVFYDNNGIYWVGTFRGGISKYDLNLPLFNIKQSSPFDPYGLKAPVVTSFAEYKNDKVFVGTDGGGLALFDRRTGLFTDVRLNSKLEENLSHKLTVTSLAMDRKGNLWVGTYHHGLFKIDPGSGQQTQFLADGSVSGLSRNDITCVTEVTGGNIWVGTLGGGVDLYDPQSKTFTRISNRERTNSKWTGGVMPLNGFIDDVAESRNGDVWVGSMGAGLGVFHPETQSFSLYTKAHGNLPDDVVFSIFFSRNGTAWVGTNSGLGYFDQHTKEFVCYAEKDGLANGFVFKILEDDTGILWLSTDKGIVSFDPIKKTFKNFTAENGVQQSPFMPGSGLMTKNGELYFGGQDGFNYFDPDKLPSNRYTPSVLLTDLKVNNNSVVPGGNSPLREQIGIAKEIHLSYGQNFSINYVAINYTAPRQNQYAYRLVGFDKTWNFVHRSRTASFTNIDPGEYTFQVKAANNTGARNDHLTEIKVIVHPPVWRTVYAYVFYALVIAGALFYIRHRGINKIRKEFEQQQEKAKVEQLIEQERREAERLHELDMLKIKFLTNLSHEFRTPISLILVPTEKLLSLKNEGIIAEQAGMINRNAKRLLHLVNQLLDLRKVEEQSLKLDLAKGDIIELIKDAADAFKDLSERKGIALSFESKTDTWYTLFDQGKMESVLFNILSNAFKFTLKGGEVKVCVTVEQGDTEKDVLLIEIMDTGVGIPKDETERIFERFFQNHQATAILNQGSGIGLSIARELIELHGGSIYAESVLGQGTTFVIKLPLIKNLEKELPAGKATTVINHPEPVAKLEATPDCPTDKQVTILIIEDNEEYRYHLSQYLKDYYHVIEAPDGKEGWQKALSHHPQLIITDISMPYMNGIELSKKIKADKRTSHVPVILLTAITGEDDQLEGLASGANDYLTKPFNFDILNAKIKNLLRLKKDLKNAYSKQINMVAPEMEIESADGKLLNAIVTYIETKLNDPDLSVEDLSKHVGMSRASLYHKILEITGVTPIEYIRSVKLEKAAILLEKSDYNVSQIAYMTGFGTPSYFSRMFKEQYDMLPSKYQNVKRKARQG